MLILDFRAGEKNWDVKNFIFGESRLLENPGKSGSGFKKIGKFSTSFCEKKSGSRENF